MAAYRYTRRSTKFNLSNGGELNDELGFRAFTIEGIDYSEVDPIGNRKDQRNVIYLLDKEEMSSLTSVLSSNFNPNISVPALTVRVPNWYTSDVFFPILDSDINIDAGLITDLEALRSYLILGLQWLGIEDIPLNTDITDLYDMLKNRLDTIDIEEYRQLILRQYVQMRESIIQSRDEIRHQVGLSAEDDMSFNQSISEMDTAISSIPSLDSLYLRIMLNNMDLSVSIDIARFQRSSSVFFKTVLKHELLHTLGLDHYAGPIFNNRKPIMRLMLLAVPEDILTPGGVDSYVERSLSCIYDLDRLRQRHPL